MSIAGGYYRAIERAAEVDCDVCQVFTKNNSQWRAKEISEEDVQRFQKALQEHEIRHPISHSSYLINLASPDDALWSKSLEALAQAVNRRRRGRSWWRLSEIQVEQTAFLASG